MKLEIILLSVIICKVTCNQLEKVLRRNKRSNEEMNNNGDLSNMFRGVAGVDYPDLKTIPKTSFRCSDQVYEGGLYADVETECQVYHVCHEGRKSSFLCGKGTIFNQEILTCDYWYSAAECDTAPSFYYVNSQIGSTDGQSQPNNYQQNPANSYQDGSYPNSQIGGSVGQSQPNNYQQNPANNYQDGSYRSSDPNTFFQGQSGDNRNQAQSVAGSDYNQPNTDKDCCCQKYSYKTPWAFPSS